MVAAVWGIERIIYKMNLRSINSWTHTKQTIKRKINEPMLVGKIKQFIKKSFGIFEVQKKKLFLLLFFWKQTLQYQRITCCYAKVGFTTDEVQF